MNYIKTDGSFLGSNGLNDIHYFIYTPNTEVKALLQISHGMCEYIERYEPVIDFLTGHGILVFGNDHMGHKTTAPSDEELGYMGKKDGWRHMVDDVHMMTEIMKKQYPDKKVFLWGHSMGSFIARAVAAYYGNDYDGLIICGTGGKSGAAKAGLNVIKLVRKFKGDRARSKFLTGVMFGSYNKKYENVKTEYDWLTHDEDVIKKYMADKYCTFTFTAAAYEDLVRVLLFVSSDDWDGMVPTKLPIFMISGDMDPVGDWGNGVREVDSRLKKLPRDDYQMKLYPDMRHEIHNEIGKEEVWNDILKFVEKRI
ncbi:MAG: alpha/beta fold hydrolase [Lachnospiraceae bacterium]|nr:alpha/beta fold hydrolase [Lachnospiraceae bacterium]MBO4462483.1 alpha/beta fold hydrolase [Lachnospiraceae bacterium]